MQLQFTVNTYDDFKSVCARHNVYEIYHWSGGSPDVVMELVAVGHNVVVSLAFVPDETSSLATDFPGVVLIQMDQSFVVKNVG